MPIRKATPEETEAWLGGGVVLFEAKLPKPSEKNSPTEGSSSATKLPEAPKREAFKSQDEFEEAMGYWQGHVGRIKGMADRARLSQASPPASPSMDDK